MANLKEIRNRITSIGSTMKITSAMKMVSAAKLKKAQDAITAMRPYSDKLTELLQNLSESTDADSGGVYAQQRPVEKVLLVVVTSNRGLCGGFNSSIIKETHAVIKKCYQGKQVALLTIGKKGNDILSKDQQVIDNQSAVFDQLNFENTAKIAEQLMKYFAEGRFDKIEIVYNSFKNAATQTVKVEQFLPIKPLENSPTVASDYLFEPPKEQIVSALIPKSLKTQAF
jgi:F-type H+-transporting ATPase subunit gamma